MAAHVVIDVEMCKVCTKSKGFPFKNEIIQIGAVMMDDTYEIISEFSTYVNPRFGKIDHFIMTLTGISERTIKNAPDIEVALEQMLAWIGDKDVVFYAWSETDYYQIRKEILSKCREDAIWERLIDQANWVDYQKSVSDRLDLSKKLKLKEALELVELDCVGKSHDGLDDAYNTARMISKLETQKDYRTLLERLREKEKKEEPLTISMGSLLQGLVLETA